jgi:hypothetical protein
MQAMRACPARLCGVGHTIAISLWATQGKATMSLLAPLRELDSTQRHTVLASFLGWTLDAFDWPIASGDARS